MAGPPRKYPPGATAADYQRQYRARQRAASAGGSWLDVMLSAQARADLDALKREGETDKAAIERVLSEARGA